MDGFVDQLEDAGAKVQREVTPGFDLTKAAERFHALVNAAIAGGYSAMQIEEFALSEGDEPIAMVKRQTSMRHRQWLSHNESRLQMRRRFETFFESYDILLLPVMPCVAIRHDHSEPMSGRTVPTESGPRPYWEINRWMAPAGACYLPATVMPVGVAQSGLPVGCRSSGRTCTTGPRWRSPPPPRRWWVRARARRTTPADVARGREPLGRCSRPSFVRGHAVRLPRWLTPSASRSTTTGR